MSAFVSLCIRAGLLSLLLFTRLHAVELKLAIFEVDATPPVGSMMAYDLCKAQGDLRLSCRGIVLSGEDRPIVLCAVDWIGIGNEGHDAFRAALAKAAGTSADRVAVHTLHQHDAPACDFGAEKILKGAGLDANRWEGGFARTVMERAEAAIRTALPLAVPVTYLGWGEAPVEQVASNRRIMDLAGKVRAVRYTAAKDPKLRAEPEGVIDPVVSVVSFWNGDQPVAVLSYYATHPQSYYRTGIPSPDFPGIARFIRGQSLPQALHVHFTGAGGNVGAGKYNDGGPENRMILAQRLADGMKRAFDASEKTAISAADVRWSVEKVALVPAAYLEEETLAAQITANKETNSHFQANPLAWVRRCKAGKKIDVGCLSIGNHRILHMPGELFVEYQLMAKQMRPDLKTAMAAYGDYGPGYIGTARAYGEGGYETSERASNVTPQAEAELTRAMQKLLEAAK
ncbi:MAG TPA: hypothetical protein VD994_15960 [Prosthecobacter sp.]|nr:hypothetical protein [Prosthecobacter sp.]